MAVTMKMISEISGVSRGTVDRVLNGRGSVHPETAALVLRVAGQLGYRPNRAGKALAARKKSYRIGVLLTAVDNPFFDELIRGVQAAETELAEFGVVVELRTIKGYDPQVQLAALNALEANTNAVIFNPIDDPRIGAKIQELNARQIAVATVNTDIRAPRAFHVGPDYRRNGRTAAGMLRLLLGTGPQRVVVFAGSPEISGHLMRVEGFVEAIYRTRPNWEVKPPVFTEDDDVVAYGRAADFFRLHPGIGGVYIAAAGTYGVCRAARETFSGHLPAIVCSDLVPGTMDLVRGGTVLAAVCQQPFVQGYEVVRRAFDTLLGGEAAESLFVADEIKILENA